MRSSIAGQVIARLSRSGLGVACVALLALFLTPSLSFAATCGLFDPPCPSTQYCDGVFGNPQCQLRRTSNQSCTGLGQGTCVSGLACDLTFGVCRHAPPTTGEVCGGTIFCAAGNLCISNVCVAQDRAVDQTCSGSGQGTCQTDLLCIGGKCSSNPPQIGQNCDLSCASNAYCSAGVCLARGTSNSSCTGVGQGTCSSGLVCDLGLGKCRQDPPVTGEVCGGTIVCSAGNLCVGNVCVAQNRTVNQTCSGSGQGTCQSSLLCINGKCSNNPPQIGQNCDLMCTQDANCIAGICEAKGLPNEPCTGVGQGTCISGLACDLAFGVCRHAPPTAGEVCGGAITCALGSLCISNLCVSQNRAVNETCSGIGQGTCQSSLLCINGKCANDPPQVGQNCDLSCASNAYCGEGVCQARHAVDSICIGVGQGSCQTDLICVNSQCTNDPPATGQQCVAECADRADGTQVVCVRNVLNPAFGTCYAQSNDVGEGCHGWQQPPIEAQGTCLTGLVCRPDLVGDPFDGVCTNEPPLIGQVCETDCATDAYCRYGDEGILFGLCVARPAAGESCTGAGQGTCASGLLCDLGAGTCRHDPPLEGEACGGAIACADTTNLYCDDSISGICRLRGAAGTACGPGVATSCASGLVCDSDALECRHEPPLLGEACGLLASCADAANVACVDGRCAAQDRTEGQSCAGTGQGTCSAGLVCDASTGTCRNDPPAQVPFTPWLQVSLVLVLVGLGTHYVRRFQ